LHYNPDEKNQLFLLKKLRREKNFSDLSQKRSYSSVNPFLEVKKSKNADQKKRFVPVSGDRIISHTGNTGGRKRAFLEHR
jgi:hypothetical protein